MLEEIIKNKQLPFLPDEGYESFTEASQREGVIASSEKSKFIGTFGLETCIGVIGHYQSGKGFVAHYDSLTDKDFSEMAKNPHYNPLPTSLGNILSEYILKIEKGEKDVLDVYVFVGNNPDEETLRKITSFLEYMKEWNSNVELNFVGVYRTPNGSIALSLDDGELYAYEPLKVKDRTRRTFEENYYRLSFPSKLEWKYKI